MAVRRKQRPPLDEKGLEQAALGYAGRYGTSRARLAAYLSRKLAERGWAGGSEPPVDRLVERMAQLGYVDDRAFAAARAASFSRRGYGERRVAQALKSAGISEEDGADAAASARRERWASALRFAERRRIGPFGTDRADRAQREKQLAAMVRAGHPLDIARRFADAEPGEIPEPDNP